MLLLGLPEWGVLLCGTVLAFGFAVGLEYGLCLGLATPGFGLLRVILLCAAMPMGKA